MARRTDIVGNYALLRCDVCGVQVVTHEAAARASAGKKVYCSKHPDPEKGAPKKAKPRGGIRQI